MPDNRPSIQVNQPDIINVPEHNWPKPLVDPSNKLRVEITDSSNGSQKNFDPTSTAGQEKLSLAEGSLKGKVGNMEDQGGHENKLRTSQQNALYHSTPESERSQ
jgi:hypothetical protein